MLTLLIILQNAYGVKRGYVPSFEKESFRKCHTGIRLKRAIPENINIRIINASPLVGRKSSANFKPDRKYVEKMYKEIKPDVILVCGKNAQEVIKTIDINVPVIEMYHPAYRSLTNNALDNVKQQIINNCNLTTF